MTIYTLGYTGWKIDEVAATVERPDAVLADVRMVPRSRNPIWNSGTLAKQFGGRYVWLKQFGNRNYKGTFEQIEIVDFAGGADRLVKLFPPAPGSSAPGRTLILLCGCPDASQCHRSVLASGLAKLWSADITHLTRTDNQISGGQQTIF
jgi:uncharacterized protein (DUF488 family)